MLKSSLRIKCKSLNKKSCRETRQLFLSDIQQNKKNNFYLYGIEVPYEKADLPADSNNPTTYKGTGSFG
jgi:hypothetical protein